jgi:regulator of RNase E activity RraA
MSPFAPYVDQLYSAVLADVLDSLGHRTSTLPSRIRPLNPRWRLSGRAVTLSMELTSHSPEKPYELEMECIDSLKPNDVLVATTNGCDSCALWGELLSTACRARGCVGAILDGLTRDSEKILDMNFPVFATGYSPLDSKGRLEGKAMNEPIRIGECTVVPNDWVFADHDGIVIVPVALAEKTLKLALEKVRGENTVRDELAAGKGVRETFRRYGIL